MSKSKGLGRGFDSLIPKDLNTASIINEGERIQNLLISELIRDESQPRTIFDESSLEELASSIKKYGIIQPLVVTPADNNHYMIMAGERRWRAAEKAGLKRVPAIVRTAEALERLEIALIENVQRVDLSPLEQAVSIERLHQQFNMSYAQIADRLGKAPSTINNTVRLLQLPESARGSLKSGRISEGHARAILALKDLSAKQTELLEAILKRKWSVRQAEQFVIAAKEESSKQQKPQNRLVKETAGTRKLSSKLNRPVTIKRLAKGGKLEIAFTDDNDLQKLVDSIY